MDEYFDLHLGRALKKMVSSQELPENGKFSLLREAARLRDRRRKLSFGFQDEIIKFSPHYSTNQPQKMFSRLITTYSFEFDMLLSNSRLPI